MNHLFRVAIFVVSLVCVGISVRAETAKPGEEHKLRGTPPKALKQCEPLYPHRMEMAGLTGQVVVNFIVDTSGKVQNPVVVSSNNPWFERPALEAIQTWKFMPAIVDGRAVNARAVQKIVFDHPRAPGNATGLWTVGKRGKKNELPPVPVNTSFPVYPLESLQAEKSDQTKLKFLVGPDGQVVSAQLLEATTPEMGQAALAMIDTWKFTPVTTEAQGILRLLERNPGKIVPLAGLDGAPKALSRRPPVFPSALRKAGQSGEALVEFFIDENGDAQLPHSLSSSAPEFGYAAVQAVATWRFEPARKDGKKVVARVRVPIEFKPGGS